MSKKDSSKNNPFFFATIVLAVLLIGSLVFFVPTIVKASNAVKTQEDQITD